MIRVNDDYVIELDSFGYTVKRDMHFSKHLSNYKTGKKELRHLIVTVGLYDSLTSAIKGVIEDMNYRALSYGVHELKEAVEIVIKHNRQVSDLLEKALEV